MLLNLHVKNLVLIEEADIEFGDGLNILSGETGAGKSIILGSVTPAVKLSAGTAIMPMLNSISESMIRQKRQNLTRWTFSRKTVSLR